MEEIMPAASEKCPRPLIAIKNEKETSKYAANDRKLPNANWFDYIGEYTKPPSEKTGYPPNQGVSPCQPQP